MTKEVKIIIGVGILVVGLGALLFTFGNPGPETPGQPVDNALLVREHSYQTGNTDAKVTVVEFADYQCPACAALEPTLHELRALYKDNPDVNFVFRHYPLPQHRNAVLAAEAAEAAGDQGKFWEMTTRLYQIQGEWENSTTPMDTFLKIAGELGLDQAKFEQTVSARQHADIINTDKSDALSLGVNATPTLFINGSKFNGSPSKAALQQTIDNLLAN